MSGALVRGRCDQALSRDRLCCGPPAVCPSRRAAAGLAGVSGRRLMRAIVTYHSIDPSGSAISVSREVFREHIAWMVRSHVRILPLGELLALPAADSTDAIAITFDDGFANFLEAAELLIAHELPVTL